MVGRSILWVAAAIVLNGVTKHAAAAGQYPGGRLRLPRGGYGGPADDPARPGGTGDLSPEEVAHPPNPGAYARLLRPYHGFGRQLFIPYQKEEQKAYEEMVEDMFRQLLQYRRDQQRRREEEEEEEGSYQGGGPLKRNQGEADGYHK